MRIVDRKTFIAMPQGTVFSKYEPCVFGELCIKGESIVWEQGDDFFVQEIAAAVNAHDSGEYADILFAAEKGAKFSLDLNCEGRDGLFDRHQLFAVWEREDVEALISRLQQTLTSEEETPKADQLEDLAQRFYSSGKTIRLKDDGC